MFRVVSKFADLKDFNYIYNVGDIYPREGMLPTPERVEELASSTNRLRIPLIEKIEDEPMKYEDTKVGKIVPVEEEKTEDKAVRKRKKKAE